MKEIKKSKEQTESSTGIWVVFSVSLCVGIFILFIFLTFSNLF